MSVTDGSAKQVGLVHIELRHGNRDETLVLNSIAELAREFDDVLRWPSRCDETTEARLMLRLSELDNRIDAAGYQLNGSKPVVQLFKKGGPALAVRVKLEFLQRVCHSHRAYRTVCEVLEAQAARANS